MTDVIERGTTATFGEADEAIVSARRAFAVWSRTPAAERAAVLKAAAARLRARIDELAELNFQETGKLLDEAKGGIEAGAGTLEQYAELGPTHRGRSLQGGWGATDVMVPEARGVVVALTPWNDPVAVACGLLGAALATGNTVVHKPSERCPRVGALLTEILAEELPEGVLRCVSGDGRVGAQLAAHPDADLIAHVGSTATGRSIAAAAATTGAKVLLENGGNDPLIVDDDVDPRWAAEQAALGSFANAGQICVSVERIYVPRAIADEFLDALVAEARKRPDEVPLARLVDERLRDEVHAQVTEAVADGARLLTGGEPGEGSFYPATVLTDCEPTMRILREETFGPVAPVRVVDDFDQALREACDDRYGLAATVLTSSMEHAQRAWRELPVGTVKVNAVFGGAPGGAAQPHGASGEGFGYGPELLDEMTRMKVVHLEPAPR
ncbi:acyl-CoA reductase-like NAD-dependent aldehyde dehydrogenase [Amycolatopsis bartoniae]|uniref:Succinate-semialdehyde dehydrogenase n=1 Tax=Amycolatopsis bartoniae TaxID=941986 RepID=A0A8H9IYZ6_9PSEU|nr:aldehyde dehydrogenase family protein [Amycolatopsis bartoniae]MBB2935841.1 acyl-CoA reductase-like NAD-dependent aldehyde dehydrogenase [Amycolatopsis bartoniae]TVT04979.1 aldehyde dehydrogenase [Amycolatopsis bartoniae]GHF62232.1 succinate-semialdehyde dehydrogenase [Amycolatopsis bartoniae]